MFRLVYFPGGIHAILRKVHRKSAGSDVPHYKLTRNPYIRPKLYPLRNAAEVVSGRFALICSTNFIVSLIDFLGENTLYAGRTEGRSDKWRRTPQHDISADSQGELKMCYQPSKRFRIIK